MISSTRSTALVPYLAVAVIIILISGCENKLEIRAGHRSGEVMINPKDGAEMVWVRAGEFIMGCADAKPATLTHSPEKSALSVDHNIDTEQPQRKVYLDGYWIYKNEVTVAQYRKFCQATGRQMPQPPEWGWKSEHPMGSVKWQDAVDYAHWTGAELPTEAQWEKAARGTNGRLYPWGNIWDASKCSNRVNSQRTGMRSGGCYPSGVSPYGCLDMAGSVWEWCDDWYDPSYYKYAPARNPTGPSSEPKHALQGKSASQLIRNTDGTRVLRGGSLYDTNNRLRCAYRYFSTPTESVLDFGFRCAVSP